MVGRLEGFASWNLTGISTLRDVWRGDVLITWKAMQADYERAPNKIFRYHQLKHALEKGKLLEKALLLEDRLLTKPLLTEGRATKCRGAEIGHGNRATAG
ncbi:hypothetical protein NDU88_007375 [Pleurodeles waltl]|uniref:Uncharacterized protein n=1 Tax=Pleurodeles waltl TaxID=8319 RepID=A0AAV7VSC8_PLEWA|nr:hypothetical protein NDU88_007375 [Pleurodeles waltl]